MTERTDPFKKSSWVIGSDPQCDIVIVDASIAEKHCELHRNGEAWFVAPINGRIGFHTPDIADEAVQWVKQTTPVSDHQEVMLTDSILMPWPIPRDGQRAYTVGRAVDCDIVIQGNGVSGRHALLIPNVADSAVLHDYASTNGLFVDRSRKHRVAAVALPACAEVFLGSEPLKSVAILKDLQQAILCDSPHTSPDDLLPNIQRETDQRSQSKRSYQRNQRGLMKTLAGVFAPTVLLLLIVAWKFSGHETIRTPQSSTVVTPKTPGDIRSLNQSSKIATPQQSSSQVAVSKIDVDANSRNSNTDAQLETPDTPVSAALDETVHPEDSLYWIVMQHNETQSWFRLATGIAVQSNWAVTAGATIESIHALKEQGFDSPHLIQIKTGNQIRVEQEFVERLFTKRRVTMDRMIEQHQKLVNSINSRSPAMTKATTEDFESSLLHSDQLLRIATEAASAVDIGWLKTSAPLTPVALDRQTKFRPGMRLTLLRGDFGKEDPFCEMGRPQKIQAQDVKIQGQLPQVDGMPGILQLRPDSVESLRSQTLFGLPMMRDHRLVAIVVSEFNSVRTADGIVAAETPTPILVCAETIGQLLDSL